MAAEPDEASSRTPRYITEIYGVSLKVPLTTGEALAAFGATVILAVVLFGPVRELTEFLFPEPTMLRAAPLFAGITLAASPLLWIINHYRPADAALRQSRVNGR